ncbi:alpha/beta hydrolase family protein [Aquisalinus flavus]|uniref:Acetyl xylan esterase domain-containing protein n=1 Tax=Aquisalinus flavus TaxID=1526572 RepID=A0A8J2Y774_9PROT|nr:acetylxylan esterase [Aquisalinus flavus]MBD0426009.1 acetylxylan esterase [Aquisalinus flavus]GGD11454.1 hypothetical protein GCM10011342_20310 [Aquisalinus flavus]
MNLLRIAVTILVSGLFVNVPAFASDPNNDLAEVEQRIADLSGAGVPATFDVVKREDGLTSLFLEGEDYIDKPTRIFGIYGLPENPLQGDAIASGKAPAVVLIHGGGGTAYAEWVHKWNAAGFAALSIAVEGQTDQRDPLATGPSEFRWKKHPWSGPQRAGIYVDTQEPVGDQWMFHAVAAVVRANNYLRNDPRIDAGHIGLVGVSWGGIITSTVMGFDNRFDFAIPIYGTGYLDDIDNQYKKALAGNEAYRKIWEPGLRLGNFTKPSLWLTWRNDRHFYLDAQRRSYSAVAGPYAVSIIKDMRHSHADAWNRPESYEFAKSVVSQGQPWVRTLATAYAGDGEATSHVSFLNRDDYRVSGAVIHYTNQKELDAATKWKEEAILDFGSVKAMPDKYQARFDKLPADTTHWFINYHVDVQPYTDGNESTSSVVVSSTLHGLENE